MVGSCCPNTASTRTAAYGATAAARPPLDQARAPESALSGYLAEAAAVFAAAASWTGEGDATLSPEFEHLRWFELPTASLE